MTRGQVSAQLAVANPPVGVCSHLVAGEEGHEVQQARQLQVLLAGLLVAAALPALLGLPLQRTAQVEGRQKHSSGQTSHVGDTCTRCRRPSLPRRT